MAISAFLISAILFSITSAVHFQAELGKWRCFKDIVPDNFTLEMETILLEEEVLNSILAYNDELLADGYIPNQGVKIRLTDENDTSLFFGDVHPNVQYEYEVDKGGEFTLCVMVDDAAYSDDYPTVKTQVKFSGEFHKNRRIRKANKKSMFAFGESNLVQDGSNEEGSFHVRDEEIQSRATTEGHFAPLFRRVEKIDKTLNDILSYQDFERQKESEFVDFQRSLYNSFFNMTLFEVLICSASAAYSVYSLRQFFVKKAIY